MSKRLFLIMLIAALMAVISTPCLAGETQSDKTGKALVIGHTLPGDTDEPLDPNFKDDAVPENGAGNVPKETGTGAKPNAAASVPDRATEEEEECKLPLDQQVKNLRGRVTNLERQRDELLKVAEKGGAKADEAKAAVLVLNQKVRDINDLIDQQRKRLEDQIAVMEAERANLLKIAEAGGVKADQAKAAVAALDKKLQDTNSAVSGLKTRMTALEAAPGASYENLNLAFKKVGVAFKNDVAPRWAMYLSILAAALALAAFVKIFFFSPSQGRC